MAIRAGSGGLKYAPPNQAEITARQSAAAASAGGSASASAYGANRRYAGLKKSLQQQAQQAGLDRGFKAQQDWNNMRFRADAQLEGQRFRDQAQLKGQDFSAEQQQGRLDASAEQSEIAAKARQRDLTNRGLQSGALTISKTLRAAIAKHRDGMVKYDELDDKQKAQYDAEGKRLDDLKHRSARRSDTPTREQIIANTFGDNWDRNKQYSVQDGKATMLKPEEDPAAEQAKTDRDLEDKRTIFWNGKLVTVDGEQKTLTLQEARERAQEEVRDQKSRRPGPDQTIFPNVGTGEPLSIQEGGTNQPQGAQPQAVPPSPSVEVDSAAAADAIGPGAQVTNPAVNGGRPIRRIANPDAPPALAGGGGEDDFDSFIDLIQEEGEGYEGSKLESRVNERVAENRELAAQDKKPRSVKRRTEAEAEAEFEERTARSDARTAPKTSSDAKSYRGFTGFTEGANRETGPIKYEDTTPEEAAAFEENRILADWKVRLQKGLPPTDEQQEVLDRRNEDMRGENAKKSKTRRSAPKKNKRRKTAKELRGTGHKVDGKITSTVDKGDVAAARKLREAHRGRTFLDPANAATRRYEFQNATEEEKKMMQAESRRKNRRKNR